MYVVYLKCLDKLQELFRTPKQGDVHMNVCKLLNFRWMVPMFTGCQCIFFYLWGDLKHLVYSAPIEHEETSPTHLWYLSNHLQLTWDL